MSNSRNRREISVGIRIPAILGVATAVAILALTWLGVRESRSDSYQLLVDQGMSFTEALAQASEEAISSESFYDYLIQLRYSDLVAGFVANDLSRISGRDIEEYLLLYGIQAISVFDTSMSIIVSGRLNGYDPAFPSFVNDELRKLIDDPELRFILLTDQDEDLRSAYHYYLEKTPQLDKIVLIVTDALYYTEAIRHTGIGYLAQKMARESGVEYIIYQSTDGIIFSSRRLQQIPSIESDQFLTDMLEVDTMASRQIEFQGKTVLEMVRPFSTERFPFGLFRVGLSLDKYYSVSNGLLLQMGLVAFVLMLLLVVMIMYLNSRGKRQRLHLQLRRMKSLTDQIFEQMKTGVAVIGKDDRILMANRALESILGVRDCVSKLWSETIPDPRLQLEKLAENSGKSNEKELCISVGGEDVELLIASSSVTTEAGGQSSIVLVIYDVTKLKEFERITARRERLSELGDLAAGVAHEIRNPLNTISIAAQRLSQEFRPSERVDEYISFTRKIRSETSRLNSIITRFLSLTRSGSEKGEVVYMGRILKGYTELLQVEASERGIVLTVDLPEQELPLRGSKDQIVEMIQNLFNNSKEALGGRAGRISIVASLVNNRIKLEFSDDGPGVPDNVIDKVFTPYFTTKEAGTGIGLATVHRIVTELDGNAAIGRSEWGGALVTIDLPLAER